MNKEDKEERALVLKAKRGESDAFGKLYDTHLPAIYRYVFLRVGGRKADAEDLTHQVFLSAWQNIHSYEFQGFPFSSWLYRIAYNAVIDYYRTHREHFDIENTNEAMLVESPNIENALDREFQLEEVKKSLFRLEPDQQSVLILRFVNDLSNKEIAAMLGKTEGAVRVIQHRALKRLRELLSAPHGEKDGKRNPTTTA